MNLLIPETWQKTKLSELAIYVLGGDWGKDADFESLDYATALCIRGAEFRNWNEDKGSTASPRKIKKSSLTNRVLKDGDILVEISGGGPDQPVGRTVLIDKAVLSHAPDVPKICTNFVRLLRTASDIDSRFLNAYLTFFYTSGEIRDYQAGSNNLRNLKFNDYLGIDIPIPPLNEQHRIVAKIEELFSELDKGIENLKTARAQLKVYRQALLKHAFEGKLTAQWRKENQGKLESAEALLKRIQQERTQRYQQQLADWEKSQSPSVPLLQSGKTSRIATPPLVPHFAKGGLGGISGSVAGLSKPKALKALPPFSAAEQAELPELPQGWSWVRPEEICAQESYSIGIGPFGSNLKVSDYRESGIPLIFVKNITRSNFVNDLKYIDEAKYKELVPHSVKALDLLITKMGDPPGDCEIYPEGSPNAVLTADCLKFRLWDEFASRKLYKYCINSNFVKRQLGLITKGVAQKKISVERFKTICLPFFCVEEQKVLVQELESKLSEVDQLELTITTSLQQAEALRQSILKKAFSGQLVAQDVNDEPASVLLARIKAERAVQTGIAKPRQPERIQPQPVPAKSNVIPFPVTLANISTTDLHAGILARAYQHHEHTPKYLAYFGHVKAEKIAHLVEAHLGIDLGREPIKAAAGPNDYPHLKKVESRAQKANWFNVRQRKDGDGYIFTKEHGFDTLLGKTAQALGDHAAAVDELMKLLLPLNTRQAEIVATLYAAWNNLLLLGGTPSDEEIVYEARESWHDSKLEIERAKFFRGLEWMRQKGLVPAGKGRYVGMKVKRNTTRKLS